MIIWLASYPRSGNTLLRTMLFKSFGLRTYSLHAEGDDKDFGENKTLELVGHVPNQNPKEIVEIAKNSPDLYLIKTHQAPLTDDPAIYVVRDGRAVVVSYERYARELIKIPETLDTMIEGVPFCGSWTSHFHDWEPETRPNTLLLRFENMTTDSAGTIDQIARFIGRAPVAEYDLTFEKLNQAEPKFFRSGSNTRNVEDLGSHIAHFTGVHGELMVHLGYMTEAERAQHLQAYVAQLRGAMQPAGSSSIPSDLLAEIGLVLAHHTQTLQRIEEGQATLFGLSHDVIAAHAAEQFKASRAALQRIEDSIASAGQAHVQLANLSPAVPQAEARQQVTPSMGKLVTSEGEHNAQDRDVIGLLDALESHLVTLSAQSQQQRDHLGSPPPRAGETVSEASSLQQHIANLLQQVRQIRASATASSAKLTALKRLLVKRAARAPRLWKGSADRGVRAVLATLPPVEDLTIEQLDQLVTMIGEQEKFPSINC